MSVPPPAQVAFTGCCPRCGKGKLFQSFLKFAPKCDHCSLDFDGFNVGDGPAAFLTLGIGGLVTILAVTVELAWSPPWWVHAALWVPLVVIGVVLSLRVAKAALLALEYRNAAREGRVKEQG